MPLAIVTDDVEGAAVGLHDYMCARPTSLCVSWQRKNVDHYDAIRNLAVAALSRQQEYVNSLMHVLSRLSKRDWDIVRDLITTGTMECPWAWGDGEKLEYDGDEADGVEQRLLALAYACQARMVQ